MNRTARFAPTLISLVMLCAEVRATREEPLARLTHAMPGVRLRALNDFSNQWNHAHPEKGETPPPSLVKALTLAARDPDSGIRQAAIRFLGLRGWTEAFPAIQNALGDASLEVRHLAVAALGSSTHPKASRLLLGVAEKDEDPGSRATAIQWLGQLKNVSAIPVLRAASLDRSDRSVQWAAINALGAFEDPEITLQITLVLQDPDPKTRRLAVQFLNTIVSQVEESSLIPRLKEMCRSDSDANVRQSALQGLLSSKHPSLLPFLTETYLAHVSSRSQILQGLGEWGDEAAVPLVLLGLNDADMGRKTQAIMVLQVMSAQGKITTPAVRDRVLAAFKEMLAQKKTPEFQAYQIQIYHALSAMGSEGLSLLIQEWEQGDAMEKVQLLSPLTQIKDDRVLPLLERALRLDDVRLSPHILSHLPAWGEAAIPCLQEALSATAPGICRAALDQLGRLKARQAVPSIIQRYQSALSEKTLATVRAAAVQTLGLLQDPQAIPTLREALKDPDLGVRTSAQHALEQLGEFQTDTFKKRP